MATPFDFLVFWRTSQGPEAIASSCASASCYRHSEDIGVVAIVVFELTFRDVERQVFGADFVIAANNRPLEDAPKPFNRICVNGTDNVLTFAVLHELVRIFAQAFVRNVFIGREQADFRRNSFAHKLAQVTSRPIAENAGHNIALALNRADDDGFVVCAAISALLGSGPILLFASDKRFINLDNAHQLAKFLVLQGCADAMADIPSCFVRAEAHVPLYLHGTDALLGTKHQVDDLEPIAQVNLGVLEDSADKVREAVSAALTTVRALPLKFHGLERIDVRRAAAWATNTLRPAVRDQVVIASLLIGEKLVKAACRQLVGFLSHLASPSLEAKLA